MDEVRLGKKITSHLQILLGNLCTALGLEKNWWKLLCLRDRDLYDSMKFRSVMFSLRFETWW